MKTSHQILKSIFHLVHADALIQSPHKNPKTSDDIALSLFSSESVEQSFHANNFEVDPNHLRTFPMTDMQGQVYYVHIYHLSESTFWCEEFESFIQLILRPQATLNFERVLSGFLRSIEMKDHYTSGHSERVQFFTEIVLGQFKLSDHDVILKGALLHDIGKLTLDLSTLNCTKKLSPEQIAMFRSHPQKGYEILRPIESLASVLPHVLHHHENFDGSGYPNGLAKNDIPLGARIIAVVDSFDAMTSDRVYRRAMSYKLAFEELRRFSKIQFDPDIVEIFISEFTKNLSEKKSLPFFLQKELHGL